MEKLAVEDSELFVVLSCPQHVDVHVKEAIDNELFKDYITLIRHTCPHENGDGKMDIYNRDDRFFLGRGFPRYQSLLR